MGNSMIFQVQLAWKILLTVSLIAWN